MSPGVDCPQSNSLLCYLLCCCTEAAVGDAGKIPAENPGATEGASGASGGCGVSQGVCQEQTFVCWKSGS